AKDRGFVVAFVGIESDRQANAGVAGVEAEFLTEDTAEMRFADEAVLVRDFTNVAGLARIVEEDMDRLESPLSNVGGHAFGVHEGSIKTCFRNAKRLADGQRIELRRGQVLFDVRLGAVTDVGHSPADGRRRRIGRGAQTRRHQLNQRTAERRSILRSHFRKLLYERDHVIRQQAPPAALDHPAVMLWNIVRDLQHRAPRNRAGDDLVSRGLRSEIPSHVEDNDLAGTDGTDDIAVIEGEYRRSVQLKSQRYPVLTVGARHVGSALQTDRRQPGMREHDLSEGP